MKLTIKRGEIYQTYEIPEEIKGTLLEILLYIKDEIDPTLSFRFGCRSGICGCCSIRVDGRENLACTHKQDNDCTIEPLRFHTLIKDLAVEYEDGLSTLEIAKTYISTPNNENPTHKDLKLIELQSDCILCGSCYSACPVLAVNGSFLGPFALVRSLRYIADIKDGDKKSKIDLIQKNGIWDCTLCGECTIVCPQNIDPKNDITNLRIKSSILGYTDPNIGSFDSGNFGFNPF